MAKTNKAKNKTTKKQNPTAPVTVNPKANPPTKTLRSRGFFYVSEKPKGSGKWRVMFESWLDGKKPRHKFLKPSMAS